MNTDKHRYGRRITDHRSLITLLLLSALILIPSALVAFPPAPHHTIFGLVRNDRGEPILLENAKVVMQTELGTIITGEIVGGLGEGVNYELKVPMDGGLTSDAYVPTAQRPYVPFNIRVFIGSTIYVPIEASANYSELGLPGARTRMDLTLGEDSDNDGLPDRWERSLMTRRPGTTLEDIKPGDDFDGDGLSNQQEYLAGSYAFDSENGFSLSVVGSLNGAPQLEFTALAGRTYTLQGAANLGEWQAIEFSLGDADDAPRGSHYYSEDVRTLKVTVREERVQPRFFRLMVR